jgi:hypothetical protein
MAVVVELLKEDPGEEWIQQAVVIARGKRSPLAYT